MLAVVILTKNSERTIEHTLNSLVESSYVPKEVVVVDGGSKDNTLEIVKKFYNKINIKKYTQLEDVTFSETLVLSLVETVRQMVRTAGMLYELLLF